MSVADSYARALYEAARDSSLKDGSTEQIEKHLDEMVSLMDSSREIRVALLGPLTTLSEKKNFIQELAVKLSISSLLVRFFTLLIQKDRLELIAEIRNAYRSVRLESEGGVAGTLCAAEPVSDSDLAQLTKAFTNKLGKKVSFQISTDPSLMAGIKVTVNGVTYDGTLRSQLEKLRDRITTGIGTVNR